MTRIALGPDELETFIKIAELGSFSRAAEALALSQPAVSNRILRLEGRLNSRLFQRTTRAIILTPAGRRLQAKVQPILDELKAVLEDFQRQSDMQRKTVTVAASPIIAAVLMPPVLHHFKESHPDVSIILRDEITADSAALVSGLRSGELDVIVSALETNHPEIEFEPLIYEECLVVGSPSCALFDKPQVTLAELAREPFITVSAYAPGVELLARELAQRGISFIPTLQVANVTTLLGLVASGIGVTLLPRFALRTVETFRGGRFATAQLADASLIRRIGMMHLRSEQLSPLVKGFCAALTSGVRGSDSQPDYIRPSCAFAAGAFSAGGAFSISLPARQAAIAAA